MFDSWSGSLSQWEEEHGNDNQNAYLEPSKPQINITMKYRKKPVEIEAIQFTKDNFKDVILPFTNGTAHHLEIKDDVYTCVIPTLEGEHIATENDYIIKGVKGEFYPCKPDIFEMTYHPAD